MLRHDSAEPRSGGMDPPAPASRVDGVWADALGAASKPTASTAADVATNILLRWRYRANFMIYLLQCRSGVSCLCGRYRPGTASMPRYPGEGHGRRPLG